MTDTIQSPGAPLAAWLEELRASGALPEPLRRQLASQATLDRWRGIAFDWRAGHHCVRLAHSHLKLMGHKPPTLPRIRSLLAAKRALVAHGWQDTADMLDSLLERVPPAAMQLGDIAVVPGADDLPAVFVCVGPRRLFGWSEQAEGAVVLEVSFDEISGAWRA